MNRHKKPVQEKSPAEIIIHVGTNDLSDYKEIKDIENDTVQLAKSIKTDATKVAVASILPRNSIFNSKAKEIKTHLQDIYSTNNLLLITNSNIKPHRHINVKGLQLNSYGDKQRTRSHLYLKIHKKGTNW